VATLFLRFRARLAIAFFASLQDDSPDFCSLFGGRGMRASENQAAVD